VLGLYGKQIGFKLVLQKKYSNKFYSKFGKVVNMKQHGESYSVRLNVILVLTKLEIMKGATHICIHLGT